MHNASTYLCPPPSVCLQISKQILMVDEVYRLHGLPEFYKVMDIMLCIFWVFRMSDKIIWNMSLSLISHNFIRTDKSSTLLVNKRKLQLPIHPHGGIVWHLPKANGNGKRKLVLFMCILSGESSGGSGGARAPPPYRRGTLGAPLPSPRISAVDWGSSRLIWSLLKVEDDWKRKNGLLSHRGQSAQSSSQGLRPFFSFPWQQALPALLPCANDGLILSRTSGPRLAGPRLRSS
jgi:hypothetical protein